MNILLFTRDFPPAWSGGISVFLQHICEQFWSNNYEIQVLAQSWVGNRHLDATRSYKVYRYPVMQRFSSFFAILKSIIHSLKLKPDLIFMGHFMTTFALGILLSRLFAPGAHVVIGTVEQLPYPDGSFDYLTCLGSLEHFLDIEME